MGTPLAQQAFDDYKQMCADTTHALGQMPLAIETFSFSGEHLKTIGRMQIEKDVHLLDVHQLALDLIDALKVAQTILFVDATMARPAKG